MSFEIGERRRQTRRRRSADSTTDSMSSFDPDDTTPLINPQDTNPNHGTFNENNHEEHENENEALEVGQQQMQNEASDDEILDRQPTAPNQRFNPFNRVTPPFSDALPVDPVDDGIWTRVLRHVSLANVLNKI